MKILKDNKGNALLLVVLTLVIVSVIGLSLLKLAANANNTTISERDDQTFFYFAEAGVNLEKTKVMKVLRVLDNEIRESFNTMTLIKQMEILNNNGSLENYYYKTLTERLCTEYLEIFHRDCQSEYKLTEQFGKQPIVATTISTKSPNIIVIESKGYFEGSTKKGRKVQQELKLNTNFQVSEPTENSPGNEETNTPGDNTSTIYTGFTVLSAGDVIINGGQGEIKGKTYTIDGIIDVRTVDGSKLDGYVPSYVYEYLPNFPDEKYSTSVKPAYTNLNFNGTIELTGNTNVSELKLQNNKSITINVGDRDIDLYVDNLVMSNGTINVIGTGKLNIYATNIDFSNKVTINQNGETENFNLYIFENVTFNNSVNVTINGSIEIKKSDVVLKGSSTFVVYGNIYSGGKNITITGGSPASSGQWIVAPSAKLTLGGNNKSFNLKGRIVVDSIEGNGSTKIEYGNPLIPNPVAPEDLDNIPTYVINTDSTDPLIEEMLIEID